MGLLGGNSVTMCRWSLVSSRAGSARSHFGSRAALRRGPSAARWTLAQFWRKDAVGTAGACHELGRGRAGGRRGGRDVRGRRHGLRGAAGVPRVRAQLRLAEVHRHEQREHRADLARVPHGPDGCRNCKDREERCPQFARAYQGLGCEDNPSYMIDVCAHSCNTCHLKDFAARCKHLVDMPESLEPGTINQTFQRMRSIKGLDVEILSEDPWIVKFPKFLTDEEIDFLKDANTRGPWEEASDTGALDEHGRRKKVFSSGRKTDVAWCNCQCQEHPVGKRLVSRISEILRVHPHYMESMQFLRYGKGMYYRAHHDAAAVRRRDDPGNVNKHRIYTFFMYLNDVTKGGGTRFPSLDLEIQPERGSAILWPSVHNHDPWEVDHRTRHEALEVEDGEKLSMNLWWHLGPHALAHYIGCSGAPIR
ncbi:unnamed protein product [Prorocentrum cordatum]|uniref:Fe2OG dioxygenase domain-containing protein n=1 Tax=Prorocentrum cordatum TaxID=2364126 RepID=A0ABN9XUZ8_9DINO|nr:unnamed protein product [Polarella glacialis]